MGGRIGIAAMTWLVGSCVACAGPESDCLRPIIASVDGDLREWEGRPYTILAVGTAQERELSGILWQGWSPQGVFFALRIYADSRQLDGSAVDVFLDTRPRSAPMDHYAEGVHHWHARPDQSAEEDGRWKVDDVAEDGRTTNAPACRVFAKRQGAAGLSVEGFVPWPGPKPPAVDQWLGLSVRCSIDHLAIGARTVNPYNPLETTPAAFAPVKVLEAEPGLLVGALRAEEVMIEYRPWLEVELAFAVEVAGQLPPNATLTCPDLDWTCELPLVPTPSRHFLLGRIRLDLADRVRLPRFGPLHLQVRAGDRMTTVAVPVLFAQRWAETDRGIPDAAIGKLSPIAEGVVRVLKVAARESAALLATAPDDIRPPQRVYRPMFSPGVYDREWQFFVGVARSFLAGREVDRDFPVRGWRSEIDGSWLPLLVAYPWNYRPGSRYPAKILIEGYVPERNVSTFIAKDLQAEEAGEAALGESDSFVISLFGRGNSFATLGAEERRYVLDRFVPSLPIAGRRLGLAGGSKGGEDALEVAMQEPDRFAWMQLRSGTVRPFLEQPATRFDASVENLQRVGVFSEVGQLDSDVSAATREFTEKLAQRGVLARFRERPGVGHLFSPGVPPPEILKKEVPADPPHVAFTAFKRPGTRAFWARIDAIADWEMVSRLQGDRGDEGTVEVHSENVSQFSLLFAAGPAARQYEMSVDGSPRIPMPKEGAGWLTFRRKASGWGLAEGHSDHGKIAGLSGPAWRIVERRMAIVYGTQVPEMTPWLRERAYAVARAISGNAKVGQMAHGVFPIYADRELSSNEKSQSNLWLVGTAQQNSVVLSYRHALPYAFPEDLPIGDLPSRLISYIYPKPDGDGMLFLECGSEPSAYLNRVMGAPTADLSVEDLEEGESTVVLSGDFSSSWKWPMPDPAVKEVR